MVGGLQAAESDVCNEGREIDLTLGPATMAAGSASVAGDKQQFTASLEYVVTPVRAVRQWRYHPISYGEGITAVAWLE